MAIHYAAEGPIAVVTIDRPERRNAVDRDHAAALAEAFRRFDADDQLAVAILTGAAGTFCAGADLHAVAEGRGNRMDATGDGPMGPTRLDLSKPVIAAIEGHAVAGGLELALWCDMRVAAAGAILGVYCRRWGVPLVDGGTVRLPRLIGHSRAMDLILTGRGVPADEALAIGLVNRVAADGGALGAAQELAGQIAAFPPRCVRSDRRSALDQWGLDEAAALRREHELGMATILSGETQEGAARFRGGAGRHGEGVSRVALRPAIRRRFAADRLPIALGRSAPSVSASRSLRGALPARRFAGDSPRGSAGRGRRAKRAGWRAGVRCGTGFGRGGGGGP